MLLYTCQDKKSLEELNTTNRFINKKAYVEEHFEDISDIFTYCYDWFVETASKISIKPNDVEYPIWCATTVESCLMPTENELVYILDIPDENIILFDGGKWDHVLNYIYLASDQKDYNKYIKKLKLKGINNQYDIFNSKYSSFYEEEQREIVNSWHRIFDISDSTNFSLQGNIWEIRKEWVLDIVNHGNSIPYKYYLIQEKAGR